MRASVLAVAAPPACGSGHPGPQAPLRSQGRSRPELPAALRRALRIASAAHGEAAVRAEPCVAAILDEIHASSPAGLVPGRGGLTGDGFPFELTCTSRGGALRYTADVAGPSVRPEDRLEVGGRLLNRLGSPGLSPEVAGQIRSFQCSSADAGGLRFGTWIGARHRSDRDSFKLYVEVPDLARDPALELAGWRGQLSCLMPGAGVPRLRMLGHEPGSETWELYLRASRVETWRLGRLLGRAGLEGREIELRAILERLTDRRLDEALPGPGIGISLVVHQATHRVLAFSLFLFARSVAGSDCRIRQRMLELGSDLGWSLGMYERLTRPLRDRADWRTLHGMIALVLTPGKPLVVHLGLRPPEPVRGEP